MKHLRFRAGIGGLVAVLMAAMMLSTVLASTAFAGGSPHFIKNATQVSLDGTCLNASFKEAGLASGAVETVTLKATVAVTYWSINGGNNHPQATNKQTYVVQVSTSGQFTADKNGNIVGSLCLEPPTASDVGFQAPPGQTAVLMSAVFTNIMIVDQTSGATLSVPGTFTYTNPDFVQ